MRVTPTLVGPTQPHRQLRRTAVAGASAAVVLGVLAGCAAGAQAGGPSIEPTTTVSTASTAVPRSPAPAGSPSPEPTVVVTPEPPADPPAQPPADPPAQPPADPPAQPPAADPPAQPPLDALVVTPTGLGPLALGAPLPVDPSPEDLVRFDPDACAGTDAPARWVPAYPDRPMANGEPSPPFRVWEDDGRVVRLDVLTPGPRTSGGIGVGSTSAQLEAAHPEMDLLTTGETAVDVWGLRDGRTSLLVEVSSNAGAPGWWSDEEVGRVVAVVALVGAPGESYYPAWGGDTCG